MRIAYLIHSLHLAGGMEKILTLKANWLASRPDTEVFVITAHSRGRKPFFDLNPQVNLIDVGINDNLPGPRYRRRLNAILHDIRPDITVSLCGADVFHLYKCSDGSRKVAEYHFLHDKFFRKYSFKPYASLRTRKLHKALFKYSRLAVLSKDDCAYFKSVAPHPESVVQIYNAVDTVRARTSALSEKRFVSAGRFSPEKNFQDALRIWEIVSGKHPDWSLDIYGDGSERKKLEALSASLGLGSSVRFPGRTPSMMDEYATASGLLVTSRYEGFGLVAVEAAACGVPTVAFACPGGLGELLSDGENAFVVPEGDIAAAAERVCRLIEDECLRNEMGTRALENSRNFLPDAIMRQWTDLFNSVVR